MPDEKRAPKRLKKRPRNWKAPLLVAAGMLCICLLIAPSMGNAASQVYIPQNNATPFPSATPRPALAPAPKPTPTPTPPPPYDFTAPVPLSETVDMSYFSDAVFIGDSRTDGLRLYSGIKGTTFFCYKGITVFDIMNRPDKRVVELDGEKYTVLEALAMQQYRKVYISLGVNELGYGNNQGMEDTFSQFLDTVRTLQPNAIIYLQNLVPVNPEKCQENKQPYWVTNDTVAAYNDIFTRLAAEKQVYLVDVASALADETGILPPEATADGIHFKKAWYVQWLDYLRNHTVSPAV